MQDDTQDSGLFTNITGWLAQPFTTKMSAFHWLLFLGLIIIGAFFWQMVLLEVIKHDA